MIFITLQSSSLDTKWTLGKKYFFNFENADDYSFSVDFNKIVEALQVIFRRFHQILVKQAYAHFYFYQTLSEFCFFSTNWTL